MKRHFIFEFRQIPLILLDSLLALSIIRISRARRLIMGNKFEGVKRSELNAAFVILLMAALPLSIYIPNAIFWIPSIFSTVFPIFSPQLKLLSAQLGYLAIDLSILVHLWNIFLYSSRVSGFRSELVRLLTCGLLKPSVTHSQSSAYSHEKSEGTVN